MKNTVSCCLVKVRINASKPGNLFSTELDNSLELLFLSQDTIYIYIYIQILLSTNSMYGSLFLGRIQLCVWLCSLDITLGITYWHLLCAICKNRWYWFVFMSAVSADLRASHSHKKWLTFKNVCVCELKSQVGCVEAESILIFCS